MIHRFCVSNFLSIREEVELDFRIPGTSPDVARFRESRSDSDIRLPSVIVLIGPNGSGKTALLRAMIATIHFIGNSFELGATAGIPYFVPFLSSPMQFEPTRIEVEFDAGWFFSESGPPNSRCRYTLELRREESDPDSVRVAYEALHTFPNNRPRRILERRDSGPIYVSRELKLRPSDKRLASVPANASAISTLSRLGVTPFPGIAADVMGVQTNVVGLETWRPDTELVTQFFRDNPELVQKLSDHAQRFDLGIQEMRVVRLNEGQWVLAFDHLGLDVPVHVSQESTGTRHLVHVFPQLEMALQNGHIAIMDALDTDFHSDLAVEVLRWFQSPETNPQGAQLICSLHNLSILDDLEKEEMFIVEKSHDGATRAHGVRQVTGLRRTENLQKQYRGGVLGGLPTIG